MIHKGGDDSSFLVPQSLWSPKQTTFIKGRTAGVRFPRLKTRNGNKEGEGKNRIHVERSIDFSHLLLQYSLMNLAERSSCLEHFLKARRICVFENLTNEL